MIVIIPESPRPAPVVGRAPELGVPSANSSSNIPLPDPGDIGILLLESGDKLVLQNGSGFLLLEA